MTKASLAELEAVSTVARLGGFRVAARELNLSSSALSHAISALEDRLRVRLFNRTTRSVALTAAGEQFVADIAPAIATIRSALDTAGEHSGEPQGQLKLNMAPGAARLLMPLWLDYMRQYPKVQLEITGEDALVDITGQGYDAGVRLADSVPPDMIAVPINSYMRDAIVASPEYFSSREKPQTPYDLTKHACIRARMASGRVYHWEFEMDKVEFRLDVQGPLMLDDSGLMHDAALAGAGLAYLPEQAIAEDVRSGRLVRVLNDWTPSYCGLSLYYSGRRLVPLKLRVLIDLIRTRRKKGVAR